MEHHEETTVTKTVESVAPDPAPAESSPLPSGAAAPAQPAVSPQVTEALALGAEMGRTAGEAQATAATATQQANEWQRRAEQAEAEREQHKSDAAALRERLTAIEARDAERAAAATAEQVTEVPVPPKVETPAGEPPKPKRGVLSRILLGS